MYIYKITNLINGKFYIGKHNNSNLNYFGSGIILKQAIKKYGKENFIKDILQYCNSKEELNQQEIYWINYFRKIDKNNIYNITDGGDGGNGSKGKKGKPMSCETKLKISLAKKGKKHKPFSIEVKQRMSKSQKGRNKGKSLKEIGHKDNCLCACCNHAKGEKHYLYGKHHSEKQKKKLSLAHLGQKLKDYHKVNCQCAFCNHKKVFQ